MATDNWQFLRYVLEPFWKRDSSRNNLKVMKIPKHILRYHFGTQHTYTHPQNIVNVYFDTTKRRLHTMPSFDRRSAFFLGILHKISPSRGFFLCGFDGHSGLLLCRFVGQRSSDLGSSKSLIICGGGFCRIIAKRPSPSQAINCLVHSRARKFKRVQGKKTREIK